MPSNVLSVLLNLMAAAIVASVALGVWLWFPDLPEVPRAATATVAATLGLLGWWFLARPIVRPVARWTARAARRLLSCAKALLHAANTRIVRVRAYARGDLEQCRSDLRIEREKYASEREKVQRLTLPLATLSDQVLRLFDQRVERPDEMQWGQAVEVSERALKCARAALSHHVTKIVYYDPEYPGSWVKDEDAEKARDHFVERWFVEKNAGQLASWMRGVVQSDLAHRSLVVFAQDIVPETVAEVRNDTCLIRKYLDAGGRVVWRGDIPLWYQGKLHPARDYWNGPDPSQCGPWRILGVYYYNYPFEWNAPRHGGGMVWGADLPLHVTTAGKDIGLAYPHQGIDMRPVPSEDIDVTYVSLRQETFRIFGSNRGSAGEFSLCWKKNFNERYPHSGFMQYVPGHFAWREVNDDFFRFAVSGWPLLFDH